MIALLLLTACNEFVLRKPPPVAPADPPAEDPDAAFGQPPDWATCSSGWYGQYYNLPGDHPDLEPEWASDSGIDPDLPDMDDLDWWAEDRVAFRRFDPSLDFGSNWWPVEQGIKGDPAYFSTRWTAWMRVTGGSTIDVVLGAQSAAWLAFDGAPVLDVAEYQGAPVAQVYTVPVRSGQFPVELRFGQLEAGESGFRFRIASGSAVVCYPEFSTE